MELTLAEFGSFSLAAKSQILSYKAILVANLALHDCELQLYCMGDDYIIKQVNLPSGKMEKIFPVANSDMLYLFCKDRDLSYLMAN
jgi:hypothetical protein